MPKVTSGFVVACDGSNHSVEAARMAAGLAKATGQSLKLLSVFPSARLERLIIGGVTPENIDAEVESFGREAFDAVKEAVRGTTDPAEEILLRGDPAKEILEYLEANAGAHLVLGRRGHSLVRSLTLGSISEKVVRHATGPVTVVNG
ncbi:universal stress protein [Marinobacter sp. S6332]|uniref:universal stress protein n=1 Tax=Marinobacter sp. S6332 TaxID=2926403 RepID=UPI001FF26852|nr:universal stress protein [Marinobacter sp. S6332]MCK0163187.1 universal stress protein [Marinobacter sp. S6332]